MILSAVKVSDLLNIGLKILPLCAGSPSFGRGRGAGISFPSGQLISSSSITPGLGLKENLACGKYRETKAVNVSF